MRDVTIEHTKKFVGPFVGYYSNDRIRILDSLTAPERAFVVAHEYYHSQDTSKYWMLRELKATVLPLVGCVMLLFRVLFDFKRLAKYISQKGA